MAFGTVIATILSYGLYKGDIYKLKRIYNIVSHIAKYKILILLYICISAFLLSIIIPDNLLAKKRRKRRRDIESNIEKISNDYSFTNDSAYKTKLQFYRNFYLKSPKELSEDDLKMQKFETRTSKIAHVFTPKDYFSYELFGEEMKVKKEDKLMTELHETEEFKMTPLYWRLYKYDIEKDTDTDKPPVDSRMYDGGIIPTIAFPQPGISLKIYGSQNLSMKLGKSFEPGDEDTGRSSREVADGFDFDQNLDLHIAGKIGERVEININSSGNQRFNQYKVKYKGRNDEFIQSIEAGNINVAIPGSQLIMSSGGSKSAFGIKAIAKAGNFDFQAIASMERGKSDYEEFYGYSQSAPDEKKDVEYVKNTYFTLLTNSDGKKVTIKNLFLYHYDSSQKDLSEIKTEQYVKNPEKGIIILKSLSGFDKNSDNIYYTLDTNNNNIADMSGFTETNYRKTTNTKDGKILYPLFYKYTASPYEYKGVYRLRNKNIQNDSGFNYFFAESGNNAKTTNKFFEKIERIYDDVYNVYSQTNRFYLNEADGLIIFNHSEPFRDFYLTFRDITVYNDIYNDFKYKGDLEKSEVKMVLNYTHKRNSFQLRHWDIVPGTEIVKVHEKKMVKNKDYTINYNTGYLEFNQNVDINPSTHIVIAYEYSPFGSAVQGILTGIRIDYKPDIKWFDAGLVYLYSGQTPGATVPTVGRSPESRMVGSIFGNIKLGNKEMTKLYNALAPKRVEVSKLPFEWNIFAEVAGSRFNPNTFGQSMIDDFESTTYTFSLPISEHSWYLAPPLSSSETAYRGKLYYRDYAEYTKAGDNFKRWLSFLEVDYTDGIYPKADNQAAYEEKPGPYIVNDGKISSDVYDNSEENDQTSLVLDYEFTDNSNAWVAIIKSASLGETGRDFRDFRELIINTKLVHAVDDDFESFTNEKVKISLYAGTFTEDIDQDDHLDHEIDEFQHGFDFNDGPSGPVITKIGGAFRDDRDTSTPSYINNGLRDTEDRDRNLELYKQDIDTVNYIAFTNTIGGSNSYAVIVKGSNTTLTMGEVKDVETGENWKTIRFKINYDYMTDEQKEIWKSVKDFIIRVDYVSGSLKRGRVLIDEIYFSGVKWKTTMVNNRETHITNIAKLGFETTVLNTIDHDDYRNNSLRKFSERKDIKKGLLDKEETFDDLHGNLTRDEERRLQEQTLVIEYTNLTYPNITPGITNNSVHITRIIPKGFDIKYYKRLKVWVYRNRAEKPTGDNNEWLYFRLGNSHKDYFEYRKNINELNATPGEWNLIIIELDHDKFKKPNPNNLPYADSSQQYRTSGKPLKQNISYVSIGLAAPDGPATNVSGELWINDIYLDNVDKRWGYAYIVSTAFKITGHLGISYYHEKRSKDFNSVGHSGTGTEIKTDVFSTDWYSIKWLPVSFTWSKSIRDTKNSDDFDFSIAFEDQAYSMSDTKTVSVGLKMTEMKFLKKTSPFWPNFTLAGTYSKTTNARPPLSDPLGERMPISLDKTISGRISANMNLPIFEKFLKSKMTVKGHINISRNIDEDYSEKAVIYTNGGKTNTNYTNKTIVQTNMTYEWGVGSVFSRKKFNMRGDYLRSWKKFGKSGYKRLNNEPQKYYLTGSEYRSKTLISRNQKLNSSIAFGKLWTLTPAIAHSSSFNESGFDLSGNNRKIGGSINVTPKWGSFRFKKGFIQSITPSYSTSLSLNTSSMLTDEQMSYGKLYHHYWSEMLRALLFGNLHFMPYYSRKRDEQNEDGSNRQWYFYRSLHTMRKLADQPWTSSANMNDSLNININFNYNKYFKWLPSSIRFSISQTTTRSGSTEASYSFNQTYNLYYGSSFDLFKYIKKLKDKRKASEYIKSLVLGYNMTFAWRRNYTGNEYTFNYRPGGTITYSWKKDKNIKINFSVSFNKSREEEYKDFYDRINAWYSDLFILSKYSDPKPRHKHTEIKADTRYNFETILPKQKKLKSGKIMKLHSNLMHSIIVKYQTSLHERGIVNNFTVPHPDNILFLFSLNYQLAYNFTKNIKSSLRAEFVLQRNESGETKHVATTDVADDVPDEVDEKKYWLISIELEIAIAIKF